MRLVLSVNGKSLDSVAIDPEWAKDVDYLQSLRRLLFIKNELAVIALLGEPQYHIEVDSRINEAR